MTRTYYLLDNIDEVDSVSDTLHKNGVADWQFHVLSKDEKGLYRHHLHRANIFQKRDLVHSGERGALIGGAVGLYLSLFILPWSISSSALLVSIMLVMFSIGVIAGGIIGNSHENYKISRFHKDLEQGRLLIMLDIRKAQYDKVMSLLGREFPQLKSSGNGSIFSNPFGVGPSVHI